MLNRVKTPEKKRNAYLDYKDVVEQVTEDTIRISLSLA